MNAKPTRRSFGELWRSRRGVASVEFAIMLPVLIVTLFGVIEIGRLLYDFHAVTKSVRDATRFLTRVGVTCPSGGPSEGPIALYIDSNPQQTIAVNLAMTGSPDNPTVSSDYLLPYWTDPTTISTRVKCIDNGGNYAGVYAARPYIPQITMTATVPFSFIWGTLVLSQSSINFTVTHNEVHVGE